MEPREKAFTAMFLMTVGIMLYMLSSTITGFAASPSMMRMSTAPVSQGHLMVQSALLGITMLVGVLFYARIRE